MHKISDKDKKTWKFYVSNFKSLKKAEKKTEYSSSNSQVIPKVLKSNIYFALEAKVKKRLKSKNFFFDALIDLHGKTEIQANEAIKVPATELAQAQSKAQSSEKSVARWKAESINYTRHQEIRALYGLEDELSSLDEILEESKNLFAAAQQAVDTAAAAVNSLPQKISDQQQVVSLKKAQVDTENTSLTKFTENKNQKASFIQQVEQIEKKNQQQASTDPENKILAEAGIKLAESLALLQKDLQTADAQLQAKQQKLVEANTAVSSAEAELATIMKMRESAPQVLKEKEDALQEAQNQLTIKQKDFTDFKVKVDQQKSKTDSLLQQYLQALPK